MVDPTSQVVEQLLCDDAVVRVPETDGELEALHRAILLEEAFDITLADHEIEPTTLAAHGPAADVVSQHLWGR